MAKYFWTYETDLPAGTGFSLYGRQHIIWMLVLFLGIMVIGGLYKKALAGEKPARRIRFAAAFAAMFLQVIQGVYRIALGVYDVGTLPLHICSIASYAVFVHCLLRKPPKWFSEILFFPLLPGALCAILFPDWTHYPEFSFMSCAGFLVHGAIVLYIVLRMADGTVQPSPKRAWAPALFLAVYTVCLIPFDRHFQVNYGFLLTPSPGSPLMFIADIFGTGAGYLFGFGLLVFAVMLLCYALAGVNRGTVL